MTLEEKVRQEDVPLALVHELSTLTLFLYLGVSVCLCVCVCVLKGIKGYPPDNTGFSEGQNYFTQMSSEAF